MTRLRRTLAALPAFLVGLAGAVALETSAGLLLFLDEGLLTALTLVLAVEVGALALGLWSSSLPLGPGAIEQIRRRWVFALVTFALAAILAMGMEFQRGAETGSVGQGLGLAFLGSLPLFSVGSLLGTMGRPDDFGRSSVASVGLPSVLGIAVGFLLTGWLFLPVSAPHTLYLLCLVALSGGALLQGWTLDTHPMVKLRESVWGGHGEIRVEERALGRPRREFTILTEAGRLRGAEDLTGNPARGWEAAVQEAAGSQGEGLERVLYLGGGSGTVARWFSQVFPGTRVEVVERSPELVELARSHFREWEGWDAVTLKIGEPWKNLTAASGPYPLILVDCAVLPSTGEVPHLEEAHWRAVAGALHPEGCLVLGGLRSCAGDAGRPVRRIMEAAGRWFGRSVLFEGDPIPAGAQILPGEESGRPAFLVLSGSEAREWPGTLQGFRKRMAEEG